MYYSNARWFVTKMWVLPMYARWGHYVIITSTCQQLEKKRIRSTYITHATQHRSHQTWLRIIGVLDPTDSSSPCGIFVTHTCNAWHTWCCVSLSTACTISAPRGLRWSRVMGYYYNTVVIQYYSSTAAAAVVGVGALVHVWTCYWGNINPSGVIVPGDRYLVARKGGGVTRPAVVLVLYIHNNK